MAERYRGTGQHVSLGRKKEYRKKEGDKKQGCRSEATKLTLVHVYEITLGRSTRSPPQAALLYLVVGQYRAQCLDIEDSGDHSFHVAYACTLEDVENVQSHCCPKRIFIF